MASSYLDDLIAGGMDANEVCTSCPTSWRRVEADFLSEGEPADQDSKSISSINSHDDALEVCALHVHLCHVT